MDLELWLAPTSVAVGAHLALRGLYFGWIGSTLRRERRRQNGHTDHEARWRAFRRRAAAILNADAITFAIAAALGARTLVLPVPYPVVLIAGLVLVAVGVGAKLAAYRVVGEEGYYWHNSFCPDSGLHYERAGIYRWFRNPMYGLGYLHAIGIPLILLSTPGLVLGLLDWGVVWAFYLVWERAHTERNVARNGTSARPGHADCDRVATESAARWGVRAGSRR